MDFEKLVFTAGDATKQPELPKGGIPRQWVPGLIRWPIRLFFLPFVILDVAMQKLARTLIRPPYKRTGKCKRRGNCCHYIMIRRPKGILGWIFMFWNTQINGFYLRSQEDYEYEGHRVMVMGCRYLKKDGSCGHHATRPMICRKWPIVSHFGVPRLLKGCGFKAVRRKDNKEVFPIIQDE